jgi:hypothetical protein
MTPVPLLVSSVMVTLTELLRAGATKGCEVLGERATKALIEAIAKKPGSRHAHDALRKWAAAPEAPDRQSEFSSQLTQALAGNPELEGELIRWLETSATGAHRQTAKASGHSTVIQIQGSGNTIGERLHGRS